MRFGKRLKIARETLGKTQVEMATILGVSRRGWQTYEDDKSVSGGKVFVALANIGFNTNWFFIDDAPMMLKDAFPSSLEEITRSSSECTCDNDMYPVPISCGVYDPNLKILNLTDDHVRGHKFFERKWLESLALVDVVYLTLIRLLSWNMSSKIEYNDLVMFDRAQITPVSGSMYAVNVDNNLLIRYVDIEPGKTILRSENTGYPPIEIPNDPQTKNLITGRVVWQAREY